MENKVFINLNETAEGELQAMCSQHMQFRYYGYILLCNSKCAFSFKDTQCTTLQSNPN